MHRLEIRPHDNRRLRTLPLHILPEMPVQVLLKLLIADEPATTICALELDILVQIVNFLL